MNRGVTYSALLRGTSYRHCFISFPHHWRAFISPATVPTFIIESINNTIVVSWAGHTHDQESDGEIFVCINSKLLQMNGFSDGEAVVIRQVSCPPPCTSVSMTVLCDSDWEELTLNIDVAQNAFLTQFRVVKENQIFPLWLEGGLVIYLKVNSCNPVATVSLLQQNTEVKVLPLSETSSSIVPVALKPSANEVQSVPSDINKNNHNNILRIIYTFFMLLGYGYKNLGILPKPEVYTSLKVINYSSPTSDKNRHLLAKLLMRHPSVIIVSERNLKRTKYETATCFIGKIHKHYSVGKDSNTSQDNSSKILAVIMIWEKLKALIDDGSVCINDIENILKHKTCILGDSLRKKLSINENSIIIIETLNILVENKSLLVDIGTVNPRKDLIYSALNRSLTELSNFCPIIINDKTIVSVDLEDKHENILLSTRDCHPVTIEKDKISYLSMHVDSVPAKYLTFESSSDKEKKFNEKLIVNEKMFNKLLTEIKRDLHLEVNDFRCCPQFILLQGNKGSGKTSMIKSLVARLRESPYFVHCRIISLKMLKGKKVDSVQKLLKPAISDALNLRPSLFVLDDIDFLTSLNTLEEKGPAYEYANHMAFMLKNLLSQLLEILKGASKNVSTSYAESVTVLATCISRNDVHSLLASPKGNHIFSKSLSLDVLSENEKLSFFQRSLRDLFDKFLKDEKKLRWSGNHLENIFIFKKEEVIPKLDGLSLSDIKNISIRVYLEAKKRWIKDSSYLEDTFYMESCADCPFNYTDTDITMAYDGFISSSMRALNIIPVTKKEIKIGGLHKAKNILEEMILWPSKYPQLFSQTTLRLRSGILLYGPPGCGKTLLAKSYSSFQHLNFITVKGPELLSKYIGQSEKAVRDAFERAASAKPCVLFFDEFESIAPRRGHDNTGVTDRVVNQLLTQMDGVEGLSGVYVLGATSRPELIDPALLRPGRLDKGVYCPMPDVKDREEILNILCEDVNMDDLVDLGNIAQRTKGYSGADLQSILSTAMVKAAQKSIGSSLYKAIEDDSENDLLLSDFETIPTNFKETKDHINESRQVDESFSHTDHLSFCVTLKHINDALAEVQPSVHEKERQRYEALHQKFSSNKEKKFTKVKPGKKQTLA